MKPEDFEQANRQNEDDQSLWIGRDENGYQARVSCWRLNFMDIIRVLWDGKIWMIVTDTDGTLEGSAAGVLTESPFLRKDGIQDG